MKILRNRRANLNPKFLIKNGYFWGKWKTPILTSEVWRNFLKTLRGPWQLMYNSAIPSEKFSNLQSRKNTCLVPHPVKNVWYKTQQIPFDSKNITRGVCFVCELMWESMYETCECPCVDDCVCGWWVLPLVSYKGRVKIYRVPRPGPSTGGRRLFLEKK